MLLHIYHEAISNQPKLTPSCIFLTYQTSLQILKMRFPKWSLYYAWYVHFMWMKILHSKSKEKMNDTVLHAVSKQLTFTFIYFLPNIPLFISLFKGTFSELCHIFVFLLRSVGAITFKEMSVNFPQKQLFDKYHPHLPLSLQDSKILTF